MADVIVALIGAVATIAVGFLGAHATIRSAEVEAGRGSRSSRNIVQGFKKRVRGIRAWTWALAVLVGLTLGLLFHELSNRFADEVRLKAMGDLAHITEISRSRVSIRDMSDEQNTTPWKMEGTGSRRLSLGPCPSRGRDGALKLSVDLKSSAGNTEWAGATLEDSFPQVKVDLVVAWVYLPPSQGGARAGIMAEISGSTKDEQRGQWLRFYGREVSVKPDSWTPLVLPMSMGVEQIPLSSVSKGETPPAAGPNWSEGRLLELTIMIWATRESYSGDVFIDDVGFFQSTGT